MSELMFIDPLSENAVDPTNAVIYGVPGAGKTALAMTAPNPLLIDFEKGGLHTARAVLAAAKEAGSDVSKARIVQINYQPKEENSGIRCIEQLTEVLEFLKRGEHEFKSVILDPIGEFQKILMAETLQRFPMKRPMGGQPQIGDWGRSLDEAARWVAEFRALPMHTIIVAHAEQPGNEVDDIHPLVTGKNFGPYLEGAMPLLGYLYNEEVEEGGRVKTKRILRVKSDGRIRAKNRGEKLPPLIADPNLTKIFARMES